MSLIQRIRDKGALISAIVIGLALLGFILMDAFSGRTGIGSGRSTEVGSVNGKDVDYPAFARKVDVYQRNAGNGEFAMAQAVEQAWNDQVDSILLAGQYEALGLQVSDREINAVLFSDNAPQEFKQAFTDPQTGVYDPVMARQQFNQVKKQGTPEQKTYLNALVNYVSDQTLSNKYTAIFTNSIHFPKWFLEKRAADNSLMANVSYVSVPYASISDSSVAVSDKEIQAYMNNHRKDFEQKDPTRSISYVMFSASPSAADSAATKEQLLSLKAQFDTTTVYENFLARNSAVPFYGGYISREAIQQPNKDSILAQPVGVVYGPYLDPAQGGAVYVLSKIIGARNIADTVKVRHVLIATQQQTQQGMMPIREDAEARRLADSVQLLHRSGTSFDSLVVRYSDDPGSKNTGGVYEKVTSGRMVPSFNDFIFTNPTGTTGIVKTDYGYHYIEIMEQKGSSPAYKVAYLAKPILASDETDNNAQNAASMFAGNARDEKSFNANWEKDLRGKGINKLSAMDIKPMDFSIQGITGSARKLVKDIFEADKGDVVGPERIGEAYVVALVTEENKAGLASVSKARMVIEPILRNQKKGEQIKKNIGGVTSLEAVAQKMNQSVQAVDSLRLLGANNILGYEPKVVGAAFNPANKGKVSEGIIGQSGVYVLRVNSVGTTPVEMGSIESQRRIMEEQSRQSIMQQMQYGGGNPFVQALKKSAKIKDNREDFY